MKRSKKLHIQAFKFIFAGAIATLIDFLIYSFLVFLGVYYLIANICSISLSTIINYLMNRNFVFHSSKLRNKALEFFIFSALMLSYYFLNSLLLYFLVSHGLNKIIAKPITSFVLMFYSFITRKLILFN